MDPLDLADPIRLLILLLPVQYRGGAAVLISSLVATQLIAATLVAHLPLSALDHPRWGRVVRAIRWYSLLRLRDEAGTTKLPGARVAAPQSAPTVALPAEKQAALVVSETRFDPQARQTVVPPAPREP